MTTSLGGFTTLVGRTADAYKNAGAPVNGVDEVQTLTNSAGSGGTFAVNFTDPLTGLVKTTLPIAWNAAAATIIAAIHLASGRTGVVSATGGPISTTPVVITFIGLWSGLNAAPMTIDNTLMTGGTILIAQTTAGVEGTARGAAKGSLLSDTTNALLYMNSGTAEKPTWGKVGTQS